MDGLDDQLREKYHFAERLGRGGFGEVFRAMNMETGEIVAIKTVVVGGLTAEQLEDVQMEIDLLSRLNHENIVRYKGCFYKDDLLCIVLEFVETGSLVDIVKKFGIMNERLVANYIRQVLQGLSFLHKQGVIHRDIKGANILITKDAKVKLADFGVATMVKGDHGPNSESPDVVGTPYWMAPEIIEMSGVYDRSDIWSVGCTVLELMTGTPPYFDMQAMSALFHIVSDEHPPFPDHVTPQLRDFLHCCFRKNPLFRPSAEELLSHPWIVSLCAPQQSTAVANTVKSEAETNKGAEKGQSRGNRDGGKAGGKRSGGSHVVESDQDSNSAHAIPSDDSESDWNEIDLEPKAIVNNQPTNDLRRGSGVPFSLENNGQKQAHLLIRGQKHPHGSKLTSFIPLPADDDDNFADLDFNQSALATNLVQASTVHFSSSDDDDDSKNATGRSPLHQTRVVPRGDDNDDEVDFAQNDDDMSGKPFAQHLQLRLENMKRRPTIATVASGGGPQLTTMHVINNMEFANDDDVFSSDSDVGDGGGTAKPQKPVLPAKGSKRRDKHSAFDANARTELQVKEQRLVQLVGALCELVKTFQPYAPNSAASTPMPQAAAAGNFSAPQTLHGVCDGLCEVLNSAPSLCVHAQAQRAVGVLISVLQAYAAFTGDANPEASAGELGLVGVLKLLNVIVQCNDEHQQSRHFCEHLCLIGCLPPLVRLCSVEKIATPVVFQACVFVHHVCSTSKHALQMFVACGGIDVLVNLFQQAIALSSQPTQSLTDTAEHSSEVDVPVALHLTSLCVTCAWEIMHMQENAALSRDLCNLLIRHGAGSVSVVALDLALRLWICPPKCAEFSPALENTASANIATAELPLPPSLPGGPEDFDDDDDEPLGAVEAPQPNTLCSPLHTAELSSSSLDKTNEFATAPMALEDETKQKYNARVKERAQSMVEKLLDIGENMSKTEIATKRVLVASLPPGTLNAPSFLGCLLPLIADFATQMPETIFRILKIVHNITQNSDDDVLFELEHHNAIEVLVYLLDVADSLPQRREIKNRALQTLFKLLLMNKTRLDKAIRAGVVPHLQSIVKDLHNPLKELAIPILCSMSSLSNLDATRAILAESDCVGLYLDILKQEMWQPNALDALKAWIACDKSIEHRLVQPQHVTAIVSVFQSPHDADLKNVCDSFSQIIQASQRINRAVGRSGFLHHLLKRLSDPKAFIRLAILRIIWILFSQHTYPALMIHEYKLHVEVRRCYEAAKGDVMVEALVKKLEAAFQSCLGV